jgi:hypothetical protein
MRFEEGVRLGRFLEAYAEMRVQPSSIGVLRLEGEFEFKADHEGAPVIEDAYRLRIDISHRFPKQLPVVWELGERIPRHIDHHVYEDGSLCLGSPLHLYLIAHEDPDLTAFAQRAIVPYLYAASYRDRTGGPYPFGELAHGRAGLLDDYARILQLQTPDQAAEALILLGMKRRLANKRPCPCGCGCRLGVCRFNEKIRRLRGELGRPLFQQLSSRFR